MVGSNSVELEMDDNDKRHSVVNVSQVRKFIMSDIDARLLQDQHVDPESESVDSDESVESSDEPMSLAPRRGLRRRIARDHGPFLY
jgi:hypothetical protein